MILQYSTQFTKKIKRYSRKNPQLSGTVQKTIKLFLTNPQHPSLRMHRLTGKLSDYYSIAVDRSVRIILKRKKDTWILTDIGTHNEVYRQN